MNQAAPIRIRRQQCGGGVMFYAALHGRNRVGPFRIDGVKMNSNKYTNKTFTLPQRYAIKKKTNIYER